MNLLSLKERSLRRKKEVKERRGERGKCKETKGRRLAAFMKMRVQRLRTKELLNNNL